MRIIVENETAGKLLYEDRTMPGTLCKELSLNDLAAILPAAEKRSKKVWKNYAFGSIPLNCIWHQVQVQDKQVRHDAVFFVPAGKRLFTFNSVEYMIPIPNLIFKFSVNAGRCTSPMAAAIKADDMPQQSLYGIRSFCPKETTQLYRYPFSNVSSDGSICMGGKSFGTIECLDHLVDVPELFMSSFMTDHSYNGANSSGLEYQDFLASLDGKDVFPEEYLVKMKITYADWRK